MNGLASAAAGSCLPLLGVDYHDLRAPGLEFKRERGFAAGECGAGPRRDLLSLGKAAELAEMNRLTFGEMVGGRGIARQYGDAELAQDVSYARRE